MYRKVVGSKKNMGKYNYENLKDDAEVVKNWEPLKFEISDKEQYDKDVPEGCVISQDPTYVENYNKVKKGSTVTVVISKGQEKTTVPNVKGKAKEEAISLLEEAKLEVEVVEETSKTVKEGYVISQETDPDTEVFAGDKIIIHVSTGTEKATVPDVVGKSQADAKKVLENQGFKVSVTTSEDSSKENGVVLNQSLSAGSSVEKGSSISITVNSFEASKTMTVNINVSSITGGYEESSEGTTAKTVSIVLKSGNSTLYSDSGVDKNSTNKSASISGKGSMDLTLTITDSNGGSWTRTKTVNFSSESSVSF